MYKISLINMPFVALSLPSIALVQLKAIARKRFGDSVSVEEFYFNHDFSHYMGMELYHELTSGLDAYTSGVGDWFFRHVAFPDVPDNTEAFVKRYFPFNDPRTQAVKRLIREKQLGLEAFLDELIDKYNLADSNIAGFTSMFTQNVACFALARKLKERNPDMIIVMGGANCESPMGQEIARNVKQIDFAFSGPALISFPEFVQNAINGEMGKNHSIKGVFSRRNVGLTVAGCEGAAGQELSIDENVPLDYKPFLGALQRNFPNGDVAPVLLFETSRGCWWGEKAHCTFCGLNGSSMAYRSMSPKNAIEMFESLFAYAPEVTRLECVDNILPREYFKEVLDKLNPPPKVTIFYEVKADLSEDDMRILAKAHVRSIQPGVEALATSTLKLMRKGTNAFQNILLLKYCAQYGIIPGWNLLVGFPGEDEDVYKKYVADLPLITHLPPPSGVHPIRFDRYSPYFVKAKEYQLDLAPLDYYGLTYPFPPESLANLAYHFADRNIKAEYFVKMAKWIGKIREKYEGWKSLWMNRTSQPMLYMSNKGHSKSIFDSRSGKPVEYAISNALAEVITQLGKPKRAHDLNGILSTIPDFTAEEAIAWLQKRGLLFQEGDRYLSLVFNAPPPLLAQFE